MAVPPFLATDAILETASVVRNDCLARDTYRLRVEAATVAARIRPGQFVMLRLAACDDPLIGRPFALFDTFLGVDATVLGLDLVYLVGGKLTRRLKDCRCGDTVEVWGPLGNGFAPRACHRLILMAGGIGMTPFLAVAQSALGIKSFSASGSVPWAKEVVFCYGARTADALAGLESFAAIGVPTHLATDDGSRGHPGFVTDLLPRELGGGGERVLCCGPEPMMAAVAAICRAHHVPCDVSLETPMACGFGACFSCVAAIAEDPESAAWDYRRTCVEGPVFDARQVRWRT